LNKESRPFPVAFEGKKLYVLRINEKDIKISYCKPVLSHTKGTFIK